MSGIHVATIGFTKTTAENFFTRLLDTNVKRIVDVRLNTTSQLAGFAKSRDLAFFLKRLGDIEYQHEAMLAPTKDILDAYKKQKGEWQVYEDAFLNLMEDRRIEKRLEPNLFESACLLCSEDTPHHCHRRLVCDYLNDRWGGTLTVKHL